MPAEREMVRGNVGSGFGGRCGVPEMAILVIASLLILC